MIVVFEFFTHALQSRLICFLLFPICRAFRAIRNEQKSKKWRDISVDVQRGREGGYFRERDLRRGRAGNLLQTFRIVEVRGVRREEPGSRQEAQHQQHTRLEPWKVVAEPHPGQGRSLRVRHYSSRPETGTSYEKKRSNQISPFSPSFHRKKPVRKGRCQRIVRKPRFIQTYSKRSNDLSTPPLSLFQLETRAAFTLKGRLVGVSATGPFPSLPKKS